MTVHRRIYLNVTALRHSSTGDLIPCSLEWEGRTYKISKVLDSRNGKNLKQKVNAQRFNCICKGTKFQLFFEDGGFKNQRFYIEIEDDYTCK